MNRPTTFLAGLAGCAVEFPALADTIIAAPPSPTTVAIGNAVAVVLTACVAPIAALAAGALWKLWRKLGFEATAADKANLEQDLQTCLAFGVAQAIPALKASGYDNIDVHSKIIADAANFCLERFPDRAAAITKAANGTSRAVGDSLAARLPKALEIAAASPATPPIIITPPAAPVTA